MAILAVLTLLVFFYSPSPVIAASILINNYQNGLSSAWEEKSFKGNTRYEVVREDVEWCIKATSHGTASGLYHRISYDPKTYPFLKWRWKIGNILQKGDELKKEGDDYAARVYVVFPSTLFWRTKAINYIWANKLPVGRAVPNPFSSNAMMVAAESGPTHVGEWREERRNVLEDFRKFFGKDPPEVGAVAIMTDTDNTGEKALAWYGPITISSE